VGRVHFNGAASGRADGAQAAGGCLFRASLGSGPSRRRPAPPGHAGRGRRRSLAGWQPEGGLDPGLGPGVAFSDFLSLGRAASRPGRGRSAPATGPGNLRRRIYLPREFGKAQPWGSPDGPCCVLSLACASGMCVWDMYLRH
jgi:hypothetical protein